MFFVPYLLPVIPSFRKNSIFNLKTAHIDTAKRVAGQNSGPQFAVSDFQTIDLLGVNHMLQHGFLRFDPHIPELNILRLAYRKRAAGSLLHHLRSQTRFQSRQSQIEVADANILKHSVPASEQCAGIVSESGNTGNMNPAETAFRAAAPIHDIHPQRRIRVNHQIGYADIFNQTPFLPDAAVPEREKQPLPPHDGSRSWKR